MIPPNVEGIDLGNRAAHDEVTRRVRNPFLEAASALPQAEAMAERSTPTLSLSSLPEDPDATPAPPAADDEVPTEDRAAAPLEAHPFEAPTSEVSRNIHHLPTPMPATVGDDPDGALRPKRHGLFVVAAVIVAGVAVDVFVWKRTGEAPAEVASPAITTDVPALPEESASKPPVPIIAPLPARSHIEISVEAEDAVVTLDGKPVPGKQLKLDVATDQDPHVLEVSAPGFAPLKRTVSFAKDLYLAIELQRALPSGHSTAGSTPPVVGKPKKTGRGRGTTEGTDEFGGPFVPTPPKRPPTAIDETDPYAP